MQHTSQRRRQSGLGWTTFQRVVGLVPRLHWHPGVARYTCVYDVELLAIWHIPLVAVVLLLSLGLHVGLLLRLPTSPSFPFLKQPFGKKNVVYSSFQPSWFASHIACCRPLPPPPPVHIYLQWPGHFWNAGAASASEHNTCSVEICLNTLLACA